MKHRAHKWKALILASCMAAVPAVGTHAFAQASTGATAKTTRRRAAARRRTTTVQSQIEQMRRMQDQQQQEIDQLKQQLQTRDQQLQQAQDAATQAQQAATQAQAQAQQAVQTNTQNGQEFNNLQQAVQSMQADTAQTRQTLQTDQEELKKAVLHPDEIHYKGVTISPKGSFIEAATVWRSAATGGGINTPFTGIPLEHADAAQMSEFFGSARQSRLALKAIGKLDNVTLTAYYEMDWLGTGITSNNNQSNSYVLRVRQLWTRAELPSEWAITAGQMWSLATETTDGLTNGSEILPSTIDPQYNAGFVWTRQYGFRVVKGINHKVWVGASAENAETLNPAGSNLPTNIVIGSAGTGGGLYNSTANYSFNLAPDMIAKVAFQPGWGHYEVFSISRFFRNRIYPTGFPANKAFNDSTVVGGIGGSLRVPVASNKLTIGIKGLYGQGMGRYGDSTIADITLRPNGQMAPLRAFSALSTIEANPTKRLNIYANYGGDYVYRRYFGNVGYGSPATNMSGCNVEPLPGTAAVNGANSGFSPSTPANCGGNNKDIQEATVGYWFNFVDGSKGRLRQGFQYSHFLRQLWSGNGGTANPGGGAQGVDNVVETSLRYYLP